MVDYRKFDSIACDEESRLRARPFATHLSWHNTVEEATVQVQLPEDITQGNVRVKFSTDVVLIEFGHEDGLQIVRLPHPPVVARACRWTMGRRAFKEKNGEAPCATLTLVKMEPGLWSRETFGGANNDEQTPPSPKDDDEMGGAFTWAQDGEHISIWIWLPEGTSINAKDVLVDCERTKLRVRIDCPDGTVGEYVRELAAPVLPDETIWQFDDDEPRQRRIRIDLVMKDLADWANGPFKSNTPPSR
ncbi:hypothetical protein CTAYLR_000309 [Chrysophaeum taylorii]|uniref:CS domain-containing protein n=1 Tax=Chrysophaeum taylorii TaxID=2483200 RepID=A0AAD7UE73_9STRA|nr:hypothetical protein CTAYLR_000309 [Chrysophaeum taylorii]